jgi:putative redox protein
MEKEVVIKYSNEEITIVWKPKMCIHSTNCWRELGAVFQPKEKNWIKPDGATADQIKKQISRCPSGALSFTEPQ